MRETDSWSLSLLAREAVRNVLTTAGRLFPMLILAVVFGSAHVAFAAHQGTALEAQLDELQTQGRNVIDLSGDAPAGPGTAPQVSRASCEALSELPMVDRAGLRRDSDESVSYAQIGLNVPVRAMSVTLAPALNDYDALLGTGLVNQSKLGDIDAITVVSDTGTTFTAYADPSIGMEGLSTSAMFVPLGPDVTSGPTCMVVLDRYANLQDSRAVLAASIDIDGGAGRADALLTETADLVQTYLNRSDRFLPMLLGVIGGLAVAGIAGLRSSELAAYRLSGTSPRSMAMLLGIEQALVAGLFVCSSALTVAILRGEIISAPAVLGWSLLAAMVWLTVGNLATLPILRKRPSDMAKDR